MHHLKSTALAGIPLALGMMAAKAADGPQKHYSFEGVACYSDCRSRYSYDQFIATCGKYPNVPTNSQTWKDYSACVKKFGQLGDACSENCTKIIEKVRAEICPGGWVACNQEWTVARKSCNDSKKPVTSPANIQCQNEAKVKYNICDAGCGGNVLEYEGK